MNTRKSLSAILVSLAALGPPLAAEEPFAASRRALALDRQIDWTRAKLIVVQDANRYKTLDSFARERFAAMYGREHLPGLSPLASVCEWLFNNAAYVDTPVVRIKDMGLRIHFTEHLSEAVRQRIRQTGYMTLRELADPVVQQRIEDLEPRFETVTAVRRVRDAEETARFLDQLLRIVPRPGAPAEALWYRPAELRTNAALALPESERPSVDELARTLGRPAEDVTPAQAALVGGAWQQLQKAWQQADADGVQAGLDRLADVLPTLAAAGVYPSVAQRRVEARYYDWFIGRSIFAKASLGWLFYLLGALFSVAALATGWRTPRRLALALLVAGLTWHAYGLALRWYLVGRIPVANMFEALVASAWVGIALALIVELIFRTRVFLLAAHVTGFFSLVIAGYLLPGGGTITTVMGILDDVMLRIHTVLIISSYALIFLAGVIALVYLFGYYFHTQWARSAQAGLVAAGFGAVMFVLLLSGVFNAPGTGGSGTWASQVVWLSRGAAVLALLVLLVLVRNRAAPLLSTAVALLLAASATLAIGSAEFALGVALTMLGGGVSWALLNGAGYLLRARQPALAGVAVLAAPAAAAVGSRGATWLERPLLAGALPGDEGRGDKLPTWLHHTDWSHLIILNMVFVMLFAGVILGAMWADYSWGRPWGWDPKETFALNTWIIYAILIHARFIVERKGIWTAWLSVAGCAMMAFNWFVVNFYIVGLHSYA